MKRVLALLSMLCALQSATALAQTVVRDGNEWLQPADFLNLSWDDINAVCPAGACSGTLSGVDVTGYTWATGADVTALLVDYGAAGLPTSEVDSAWAPALLADFNATLVAGPGPRVIGTVADLSGGLAVRHFIEENTAGGSTDNYNSATDATSGSATNRGAWFFRPVPPPPPPAPAEAIPTLGTYGLALSTIGLLILGLRRLSGGRSR